MRNVGLPLLGARQNLGETGKNGKNWEKLGVNPGTGDSVMFTESLDLSIA